MQSRAHTQTGDKMTTWLHEHPEIKTIRIAASDLNGQARGKRIPTRYADKMEGSGARFPLSVLNLDIWGNDIENSPLVFDSGDADGVLQPTERGFVPMPWLNAPTALLPIWMFHDDGRPFDGDPRHALNSVVSQYKDLGLTPVVAMEMEFYLIDDRQRKPQVPVSPTSGKRRHAADTLSLSALDSFDEFFTDLYDACEDMGIPADTAISESGLGQFEINLMHCDDALRAADDAWLFKMLVKGIARRHGFAASFMAKPYPDYAGSGLHTHFSVLDDAGKNIFDDGSQKGSDVLRHAVAGCIDAMSDCTLIFAPHANSYDRMVPDSHAPTGICWGYENRTAAIRIPSGSTAARRIEHRVAGGDVSPYLLLTAILGAALVGIQDKRTPPAPITGSAYNLDVPQLCPTWSDAIDAFDASDITKRIFPENLIRNMVLTKRQEHDYMKDLSQTEQAEIYLETV